MNFDTARMYFFQQMKDRLEEIKKNVPDLSKVDDKRKKIFNLTKRIDKYFREGKYETSLKAVQQMYELTKSDLPFIKFFKFDEKIFDKKQKFSNDLLRQCLTLYCEFIGCSRALYRDEDYKVLFSFIKEFIKFKYVY